MFTLTEQSALCDPLKLSQTSLAPVGNGSCHGEAIDLQTTTTEKVNLGKVLKIKCPGIASLLKIGVIQEPR